MPLRLLAFLLVSLAGPSFAGSVDRPAGEYLGESLSVTTLEPGVAVNVEKLARAIEMLEDREGRLGIDEVSAMPPGTGFVAGSLAAANVGFSPSVWWVRFTLRNPGAEPRIVYLRQDYPLIDQLDFYEPSGGGWRVHSTGDRRPFGSRDVQHRDFLFPVLMAPEGERTFYLRYQSQG